MTIRISVDHVSLQVPNYVQEERSASSWFSTLVAAATSGLRRESRTLLTDIDFSLVAGDRLAMLGSNGAGKTTLLRVMAGSLQPTVGRVTVDGSRQALLNLSLGFNPEATVKENIYLRGTAMGLRPAVIRDLVKPILEFAELAHVSNHRLATLSAGQRMRLGFSVSTAVQHDIMLLDEWFGAGDTGFLKRARERMSDRVEGSKIVVLASHNLSMLRKVCNKGLVMDQGRIAYFGSVEGAVDAYKAIYQSTDEYQAGRRAVEEEAERMVRSRLRELKEAAKVELAEERERYRAMIDELKQEKARLKEIREDAWRIRGRLRAREDQLTGNPGRAADTGQS
ncbi:ATP-binding cassette domain-containing protein [Pseudoxanthomonas mexicana]|uniref:ABC transporter ATP-binding protein n=1 Tax=Pseudoxanthomonas mexicana TaxID=128785 RepID=UPI0028AFB111|nr:ATP-binding cassette domain-containing protein [Pseudoxanthomonas mexicana]